MVGNLESMDGDVCLTIIHGEKKSWGMLIITYSCCKSTEYFYYGEWSRKDDIEYFLHDFPITILVHAITYVKGIQMQLEWLRGFSTISSHNAKDMTIKVIAVPN